MEGNIIISKELQQSSIISTSPKTSQVQGCDNLCLNRPSSVPAPLPLLRHKTIMPANSKQLVHA
jgi:hypothetical protein